MIATYLVCPYSLAADSIVISERTSYEEKRDVGFVYDVDGEKFLTHQLVSHTEQILGRNTTQHSLQIIGGTAPTIRYLSTMHVGVVMSCAFLYHSPIIDPFQKIMIPLH